MCTMQYNDNDDDKAVFNWVSKVSLVLVLLQFEVS